MRWRRRRPEPARPAFVLDLRLERARFGPGETVRGSVLVVDGAGGRTEARIALSLRERSTRYEAVAARLEGDRVVAIELAVGSEARFEIAIPAQAQPSLVTPHGGIWWTVEALAMDSDAPPLVSRGIEITQG